MSAFWKLEFRPRVGAGDGSVRGQGRSRGFGPWDLFAVRDNNCGA